MDRASEEQNRGTQEQIVSVEVISTIHEERPGEHLHAAVLPVRRERFPGGAVQCGQVCDPHVRRSRAGSQSCSRRGRSCSTARQALCDLLTHISKTLTSQGGQLRTGKSECTSNVFSMWCCVPLCPCSITSPSAEASKKGDFDADEDVQDVPGELRQHVVGVGGTQEEQGREWLAV